MQVWRPSRYSGRNGRVAVSAVCALVAAALVPLAGRSAPPSADVPASLLAAAQAAPDASFRVIVQARPGRRSSDVAGDVAAARTVDPGDAKGLRRRFVSIAGVSAQLTGKQVLFLAARPGVLAITPDTPLTASAGPTPTSGLTVAGLAQAGETLTVTAGVWAGDGPVSFTYQWQRCDASGSICADLAGATDAAYTATDADVGSTLRVVVTATDASGTSTDVSGVTGVVAAAPPVVAIAPPAATVAPSVTGTAQDGGTLTATLGTWTGATGYAYRWQRCSSGDRSASVTASAPLGWWPFADSGPVATDATGHGLSGTYVGAAAAGGTGVAGDAGALQLDGSTGAVDVAGLPVDVFAHGFTLEAWVKADRPETDAGIVGKWNYSQNGGALLWIDGSGRYALVVSRSSSNYLTTDVEPTVGRWEHLVGTWDGTSLRLYLNGALIGSRPYSGDPGSPTSDLLIGDYGGGGYRFSGALDEVAVYDHALSPAEIDDHAAGCVDLAGATDTSVAVGPGLIGSSLRFVVTASGDGGSSSAASTPTDVVTAAPPRASSAPAVTGTAATGRTLTATPGTWTGTGPLTYAYQWQRCDSSGACASVSGATGATYTAQAADAGSGLRVVVTATGPGGSTGAASPSQADVAYSSAQVWPYAMGVDKLWPSTTADNPNAPAIAIVDSGVDASRSDFGDRVVKQVTLTSLTPNSPGDGRGHGTFVADVAAGGGPSYAGAAPDARIVSLDVMDDSGMALTSDVIAAADWIYQNKDAYGIRVANLSLQESAPSSIEYDPLDKAVEKLWLSGVVVVAAAGNFAVDGAESGVPYAPANDPFVITVGAADVLGTVPESDDVAAPWSAYGHTGDGFAKPDIAAPGRYVVAAVPATSTLAAEHPDQLVDGGYMQLSGTSFSAAAVSGVAADLLEAHPTWTPDQVKGALMATAVATSAAPNAFGVGEISAPAAASASNPPNPNGPLSQYVVPDPSGGPTPVFDAEAWGLAVANDPAWAQEAWGLEAWGLEAWGLEAWGLNYWEAPPSALDPGSTSPTSSATPVNVETDVLPAGGYWLSPRG